MRSFINELRVAVINEDAYRISMLYDDIPKEYNSIAEMIECATLIQNAIKILEMERSKIFHSMTNIDLQRKFIIQDRVTNSLDIRD
jgi:hypothetical protein